MGRDEPPELLKSRQGDLSPPCRLVGKTEQLTFKSSNTPVFLMIRPAAVCHPFVKQVTHFSGCTILLVYFGP